VGQIYRRRENQILKFNAEY